MNADELMSRILAHGADEAGIQDRFGGNNALYELCFQEFLEIPAHTALKTAIAEGDCEDAFTAAHALKGLSGNLGLSDYYAAISALTESLRAKHMENAPAELAEVERRYKELAALYIDTAAEPPAPPAKPRRLSDRSIAIVVFALLAIAAIVFVLFTQVAAGYADTASPGAAACAPAAGLLRQIRAV